MFSNLHTLKTDITSPVKSSPATRHGGAWGERRCSSYSFSTSALDGVSGQRHAPAALLPPGKGPPVPVVQEAGWASEPVWTQRIEEKSLAPAGDRSPVVQPVVRHCTAWANPAPNLTRANKIKCAFFHCFQLWSTKECRTSIFNTPTSTFRCTVIFHRRSNFIASLVSSELVYRCSNIH
jgi:hypothetical protein